MRILFLTLGLFCLPSLSAHADSLTQKGDAFLARERLLPGSGRSEVILGLRAPLRRAERAQLRRLNFQVRRDFPRLDLVSGTLPRKRLTQLAALPFVVRLSADTRLRKSDDFTVRASGADIAADPAQGFGYTGAGVGIAIVDSGIDSFHPDLFYAGQLKSRIAGKANFVTGESGSEGSSTADRCGHGTHVAGIAAGNAACSSGSYALTSFRGIAPQATLVNARILNRLGQGSVSDAIAGIEWVIEKKDQFNIRVLNFSAGHPVGESYKTDPLCKALKDAWEEGIVVVCAAGNQGRLSPLPLPGQPNEGFGVNYGSIQSPANSPYVITVGAMKRGAGARTTDRVASYSSRGPTRLDFVMKPDLVAPGNRVVSLSPYLGTSYLATTYGATNSLPWNAYLSISSDSASRSYYILSGTSMAAPVVAGAAALLIQQSPASTPDSIKMRLMLGADNWVGPDGRGDVLSYGAGYLNLPSSLSLRSLSALSSRTPSLLKRTNGFVSIDPASVDWGTSGSRFVWGTDGLSDLRFVWGTAGLSSRFVWGTTDWFLPNSSFVWGTGLWGDLSIASVPYSNADMSFTALYGE